MQCRFEIYRIEKKDFEYKIYPDTILNIKEIGKTIRIYKTEGKGDIYLEGNECLTVRNRRCGDVFFPAGMEGRKKLSDYFTDKKVPSFKRDTIPIILNEDEIVSVGNMRSDRRYLNKEKNAYKIEIKEDERA